MKQPQISQTRVNLLLAYAFIVLGIAMVAYFRSPHRGLWWLACIGSIPIVAAIIAGWPERSEPESN